MAELFRGTYMRRFHLGTEESYSRGERVYPVPGWIYLNRNVLKPSEGTSGPTSHADKLKNEMVKVTCTTSNQTIYRRLKWGTHLQKNKDQVDVAIDWDSWVELRGERPDGEKAPEALTLKFERTWNPFARLGFGHPDPSVRAAAWLGGLGLLTGFAGLCVSIAGAIC